MNDEKKHNVFWLIERIDAIRMATENRAAIVLSAGAILMAGIAFLFDKALISPTMTTMSSCARITLVSCLILALLFLLISVVYATVAIVNIFTTSRRMLKNRIPSRVFFHSFDTQYVYPDFESFKTGYLSINEQDFFEAALAHLWSSYALYVKRYLALRMSIRCLLLSVAFLGISALVVIFQTL